MKLNKLHLALLSTGLLFGHNALAHVCNVDVTTPSACGEGPDYAVFTPKKTGSASAGFTYTLGSAAPQAIPAGFVSDTCPTGNGGDWIDPATGTVTPDPVDPTQNLKCALSPAALNGFNPTGWYLGTTRNLGESHQIHGGNFFTFTLTKKSSVTIKLSRDTAYVDPITGTKNSKLDSGFSVYEHLLTDEGHEDNLYDPTVVADSTTGYYATSAADKEPGLDPGIAKYILDPNTGTTTPNPAYTGAVASLYSLLYPTNGPWRDTQNFTGTGGLAADGLTPNNLPVGATYPYIGQFNAKGNWSLASADAAEGLSPFDPAFDAAANDPVTGSNIVWQTSNNLLVDKKGKPVQMFDGTRKLVDPVTGATTWSEVRFLKLVNANTGSKAATAETVTLTLQPGEYTIAAGDANATAPIGSFAGVLSVTIK